METVLFLNLPSAFSGFLPHFSAFRAAQLCGLAFKRELRLMDILGDTLRPQDSSRSPNL